MILGLSVLMSQSRNHGSPDRVVSVRSSNPYTWSRVQALLVFAHVVSEDKVAGFPDLFIQLNDFAHDVCRVAVFTRIGLSYHCQVLLFNPRRF